MRQSIMILFLALSASLYSLTANAYVIHNNIGMKARFRGEYCDRCFNGRIENGDWGACPGSKRGCRNETEVSLHPEDGVGEYMGMRFLCWLKAGKNVTAHGDVYAYKDHVVVKNDEGIEIYNGPWKEGCSDGMPAG